MVLRLAERQRQLIGAQRLGQWQQQWQSQQEGRRQGEPTPGEGVRARWRSRGLSMDVDRGEGMASDRASRCTFAGYGGQSERTTPRQVRFEGAQFDRGGSTSGVGPGLGQLDAGLEEDAEAEMLHLGRLDVTERVVVSSLQQLDMSFNWIQVSGRGEEGGGVTAHAGSAWAVCRSLCVKQVGGCNDAYRQGVTGGGLLVNKLGTESTLPQIQIPCCHNASHVNHNECGL